MLEDFTIEPKKILSLEKMQKETLRFLIDLSKEYVINNSYSVIDPEQIEFKESIENEFEYGDEQINNYTYKASIGDLAYDFHIATIDGKTIFTNSDGEDQLEFYHCGRIDFTVDGSEFITNIGLQEIHKADELIKDLFRFIYSKNRATYLVVNASKMDVKLSKDNDGGHLEFLNKIEEIIRNNEVINIDPLMLPYNSDGFSSFKVINNNVTLGINNNQQDQFDIKTALENINFKKIIAHKELRLAILKKIVDSNPLNNKKQLQRLKLYERRLSRMGFSIEIFEDTLYAGVTSDLLENLFSPIKVVEKAENMYRDFVDNTGIVDPSIADIQKWRNKNKTRDKWSSSNKNTFS